MKEKAIIIDLDGTLCNVEHRVHYMQEIPKRSCEFHSECVNDPIVEPIAELVRAMHAQGVKVIILTARPVTYATQTRWWLNAMNVPYDQIFMGTVPRPDREYKRMTYFNEIEPYYDVLFVVEDRADVVRMWREHGVLCLDCANREIR